jgi:hypothetical protein
VTRGRMRVTRMRVTWMRVTWMRVTWMRVTRTLQPPVPDAGHRG